MTVNPMRSDSSTTRFTAVAIMGASLLCVTPRLCGNDSAAEVAAGGIQLRKEARISMEKERLTISLKKVTVEYEFLNTTDQDITTEVAFPIPPYIWTPIDPAGSRDFSSFHVWINGSEVRFRTKARATLKGADYTQLLQKHRVDIQNFGYVDRADQKSQIAMLSRSAKAQLISVGLIDEDGLPYWTVHLTYHWRQRFPARNIVQIRHEYAPVYGFARVYLVEALKQLESPCTDLALENNLRAEEDKHLEARRTERVPLTHVSWVKYILTTANTWRTPIKDFQLVIEQPEHSEPQPKYLGTRVCWDGEVRPSGKNRFVAKRLNTFRLRNCPSTSLKTLTSKRDDNGLD
jgi:hypothetical protein